MYVHYGCGHTAPPEWINFDSSLTLRWEKLPLFGSLYTKNAARFPANVRYGDIIKGLPLAPGSCAGVFSSHVLEHLSLDEFHTALKNSRDILKTGGILRVVVPDLEFLAREYLQRLESGDGKANCAFLAGTDLGIDKRSHSLSARLFDSLRNSKHQWMWDSQSLQHVFQEHGFEQVRACVFGDCSDPMFRLVEHSDRFINAAAVEGRR